MLKAQLAPSDHLAYLLKLVEREGASAHALFNRGQKGVVCTVYENMTYTAIKTRCFGLAIHTCLRFPAKNSWAPGSQAAYCLSVREIFLG